MFSLLLAAAIAIGKSVTGEKSLAPEDARRKTQISFRKSQELIITLQTSRTSRTKLQILMEISLAWLHSTKLISLRN